MSDSQDKSAPAQGGGGHDPHGPRTIPDTSFESLEERIKGVASKVNELQTLVTSVYSQYMIKTFRGADGKFKKYELLNDQQARELATQILDIVAGHDLIKAEGSLVDMDENKRRATIYLIEQFTGLSYESLVKDLQSDILYKPQFESLVLGKIAKQYEGRVLTDADAVLKRYHLNEHKRGELYAHLNGRLGKYDLSLKPGTLEPGDAVGTFIDVTRGIPDAEEYARSNAGHIVYKGGGAGHNADHGPKPAGH